MRAARSQSAGPRPAHSRRHQPTARRQTADGSNEQETTMNQPARKRSGLGRGLAALIPTGPAEDGTDALSPRIGATAADVLLGPSATPGDGGTPPSVTTPAAADGEDAV